MVLLCSSKMCQVLMSFPRDACAVVRILRVPHSLLYHSQCRKPSNTIKPCVNGSLHRPGINLNVRPPSTTRISVSSRIPHTHSAKANVIHCITASADGPPPLEETTRDVAVAKKELLAAIEGTERGVNADKDTQERVSSGAVATLTSDGLHYCLVDGADKSLFANHMLVDTCTLSSAFIDRRLGWTQSGLTWMDCRAPVGNLFRQLGSTLLMLQSICSTSESLHVTNSAKLHFLPIRTCRYWQQSSIWLTLGRESAVLTANQSLPRGG